MGPEGDHPQSPEVYLSSRDISLIDWRPVKTRAAQCGGSSVHDGEPRPSKAATGATRVVSLRAALKACVVTP